MVDPKATDWTQIAAAALVDTSSIFGTAGTADCRNICTRIRSTILRPEETAAAAADAANVAAKRVAASAAVACAVPPVFGARCAAARLADVVTVGRAATVANVVAETLCLTTPLVVIQLVLETSIVTTLGTLVWRHPRLLRRVIPRARKLLV
eukprot:SAG31_NODE_5065_length_2763_cov_1.794670_2_plen_152_part_00